MPGTLPRAGGRRCILASQPVHWVPRPWFGATRRFYSHQKSGSLLCSQKREHSKPTASWSPAGGAAPGLAGPWVEIRAPMPTIKSMRLRASAAWVAFRGSCTAPAIVVCILDSMRGQADESAAFHCSAIPTFDRSTQGGTRRDREVGEHCGLSPSPPAVRLGAVAGIAVRDCGRVG